MVRFSSARQNAIASGRSWPELKNCPKWTELKNCPMPEHELNYNLIVTTFPRIKHM